MVTNEKVAEVLAEMGRLCDKLTEHEGGGEWRAGSYARAAEKLRTWPVPLEKVRELQEIPGVGKGIAQKIQEIMKTGTCEKLKFLKTKVGDSPNKGRITLSEACKIVFKVTSKLPKTIKAYPAGSVRRLKETIGDIDIVVVGGKSSAEKCKDIFDSIDEAGPLKIRGKIDGVQVDLIFCKKSKLGSNLLYFTGSKEFNILCRGQAKKKGLKLNRHGFG